MRLALRVCPRRSALMTTTISISAAVPGVGIGRFSLVAFRKVLSIRNEAVENVNTENPVAPQNRSCSLSSKLYSDRDLGDDMRRFSALYGGIVVSAWQS